MEKLKITINPRKGAKVHLSVKAWDFGHLLLCTGQYLYVYSVEWTAKPVTCRRCLAAMKKMGINEK